MISDYSTRPAELSYLAELFDNNGAAAAASAANDTAKKAAFSASLPQRVSDKLYYMTQNMTENGSFDDLGGELDALEQYETALEAENATGDEN